MRPGQRGEGKANVGEDVEDVAVRGIDEPAHVLDPVGVVAELNKALDEGYASPRVAPGGPQLAFGGNERADVPEELVHELLSARAFPARPESLGVSTRLFV